MFILIITGFLYVGGSYITDKDSLKEGQGGGWL